MVISENCHHYNGDYWKLQSFQWWFLKIAVIIMVIFENCNHFNSDFWKLAIILMAMVKIRRMKMTDLHDFVFNTMRLSRLSNGNLKTDFWWFCQKKSLKTSIWINSISIIMTLVNECDKSWPWRVRVTKGENPWKPKSLKFWATLSNCLHIHKLEPDHSR